MIIDEELEWLARNVDDWQSGWGYLARLGLDQWEFVHTVPMYSDRQWFNKYEFGQARRELGLDKTLDNATPAEWDAASRAARMPVTEEEERMWKEIADKPELLHQGYEHHIIGAKSKYHKRIKGVDVDVYDVLKAFGVTNPADAHAIKKILAAGKRGYKDAIQDRREAIQSLERAIELESEQ